jgi:molybdate transport repressor ModE-like protein
MVFRTTVSVSLENEEGLVVLDSEKFEILKAIRKAGSITKAAEKLGRHYRRVWGIVKEIEDHYGLDIVAKSHTGSSLTPEGDRLLLKYEQLARACKRSAKSKFKKLFFA